MSYERDRDQGEFWVTRAECDKECDDMFWFGASVGVLSLIIVISVLWFTYPLIANTN